MDAKFTFMTSMSPQHESGSNIIPNFTSTLHLYYIYVIVNLCSSSSYNDMCCRIIFYYIQWMRKHLTIS